MNITHDMLSHVKVIRLQHAAEARVKALEAVMLRLINRECQGFFDRNMQLNGCSRCWPRPTGRPTDPCTYETDCPIARARALLEVTP